MVYIRYRTEPESYLFKSRNRFPNTAFEYRVSSIVDPNPHGSAFRIDLVGQIRIQEGKFNDRTKMEKSEEISCFKCWMFSFED